VNAGIRLAGEGLKASCVLYSLSPDDGHNDARNMLS